MKDDLFYQNLITKMREVATLPPQEVGPFTSLYKRVVPNFKTQPWKTTTILSVFATFLFYILFGTTLIKVVSLLQFGF